MQLGDRFTERNMGSGHDHGASHANEKTLWCVLTLTTGYLVVEVIGGMLTRSLALWSDAAHMLTDSVGLAIALAAIRIARKPADRKRTFGYHRFEILAAAFNASILVGVAAFILWDAVQRIIEPVPIHSTGMLVIACVGLLVNLASMQLLRSGSDGSLNLKGAYLEVWSDMISSLGVIAAALIIRFTGWLWVDALVAAAIGLWVLPRTWILLKESLNILLEGIPKGIELDDIEQSLLAVPGVAAVHDLHVWALTSGKNSLTVHLVLAAGGKEQAVLAEAHGTLAEKFSIHHTTVQVEADPCVHANAGRNHFPDPHRHDHGHEAHGHGPGTH
jgi:cobalt-zinc-cadmium efflux system protein